MSRIENDGLYDLEPARSENESLCGLLWLLAARLDPTLEEINELKLLFQKR